jgi:hypothetical protein
VQFFIKNFMALIATGNNNQTEQKIIENDGFFPDIHLVQARDTMRVDGTVTPARLIEALVTAILYVNQALSIWKKAQQDKGYAALTSIPAPKIGQESAQLHHYRRAVYSYAMADLAERYRNFDSTKSGHQQAQALEEPIDDHRRNAQWALNDMMNCPRSTIDLI